MKHAYKLAVMAIILAAPTLGAQPPAPAAPQTPEKVQLPKSQIPDLGRTTKPTDVPPLFNFDDYFIGKWNFTWDVPEGPLGPAGTITGTTVFKRLDDRFYEATTEGTGPGGPIKMKEIIGYLRDNKTLARQVTDSRGFSFTQIGTIGGDLGGYFNIYYESAPFTYNGTQMRFKSSMRLLSPINYKTETKLSVAGGPYMNFGNPWWRKEVPGLTNKP